MTSSRAGLPSFLRRCSPCNSRLLFCRYGGILITPTNSCRLHQTFSPRVSGLQNIVGSLGSSRQMLSRGQHSRWMRASVDSIAIDCSRFALIVTMVRMEKMKAIVERDDSVIRDGIRVPSRPVLEIVFGKSSCPVQFFVRDSLKKRESCSPPYVDPVNSRPVLNVNAPREHSCNPSYVVQDAWQTKRRQFVLTPVQQWLSLTSIGRVCRGCLIRGRRTQARRGLGWVKLPLLPNSKDNDKSSSSGMVLSQKRSCE